MDTKKLGTSKIVNLLFKPAGLLMGSRVRQWIFDPVKTLGGSGITPGQSVLEVGCGTGFFTIPAARLLGEDGQLVALDASAGFLKQVARKVEATELKNVRIIRRDALDTGLEAGSLDLALLFGVIPFPLLPLGRLLPEMHRVLKPNGALAVWLFPPLVHAWVPQAIVKTGLFADRGRRNAVYNFIRR